MRYLVFILCCLMVSTLLGQTTVLKLTYLPGGLLKSKKVVIDPFGKRIIGDAVTADSVLADSNILQTVQDPEDVVINTLVDVIGVYPNPATEIVHVKVQDHVGIESVQVIDMLRKVIIQERYESLESSEVLLNVSGLKASMYILVVHTGSKSGKDRTAHEFKLLKVD